MGRNRAREVIIGVFLLAALGLTLAPRLARAIATADEAEAIGDIREVAAAEDAYAAANQGYYADVTRLCKAGNGECTGIGIPFYVGPDFIRPELGRKSPYLKGGTVRSFTGNGTPNVTSGSVDPWSSVDYCYDASPEVVNPNRPARAFSITSQGILYEDVTGTQIACPVPHGTWEAYDTFRRSLAVDFGDRGLWLYDSSGRWSRLSSRDPVLIAPWREGMVVSFENGSGLWAYDANGWNRLSSRKPSSIASEGDRLFAAFPGQGLWVWDASGPVKIDDGVPLLMESFGSGLAAVLGPGRGVSIWFPHLGWRKIRVEDPYLFREIDGFLVAAFAGEGVLAFHSTNIPSLDWFPSWDWWQPVTTWEPEQLSRFRRDGHWYEITGDFGAGLGIWADSFWGDQELETEDPYLLADHEGALVAAFHSGLGLRMYDEANGWRPLTSWEPTSVVSAETYLAAAFDNGRGLYRYDEAAGWVQIRSWDVESMVAVRLEGQAGRGRSRRGATPPGGRRRRVVP